MAIYRIKRFAQVDSDDLNVYGQRRVDQLENNILEAQKTSKDLQIEQMKMQRAMMANQRSRQKLQEQERQDRLKQQLQTQKLDQKKDEQSQKSQVQTKKLQSNDDSATRNWNLVKKNTTAKPPIPMK